MEYGLVMYRDSPNLGDDIQSYAASRLLPRVDHIVEREELDSFRPPSGRRVAVFMNGWFLYNHLNWPPSPYITPHLVSLHFDTFYSAVLGENMLRNFVLDGYGAEWLVRHGPVGCRDAGTERLLADRRIPAFFSGCLTLAIEPFKDAARHGRICAVDVPAPAVDRIRETARSPVECLTHYIELGAFSVQERFRLVEERLRLYQGASLVITTRLHAALPSLALGTPVLFLKEDWSLNRTDSYLPYLNHVALDDFVAGGGECDCGRPPENPTLHVRLGESLRRSCREFIDACGTAGPIREDGEEFFRDGVKRLERLKKLMALRVDKYQRIISC